MKKYRHLRWLRIGVSLFFALALAWITIDASLVLTCFGSWVLHTQIVPAVLAGSAIWLVLWVLVTLTFGRIYCSSVCPLGTAMDVVSRCRMALPAKVKYRHRYMPPLSGLRFLIPAIVCACLFTGITRVVELTDPTDIYRHVVLAVCKPLAITAGSLVGAYACALLVAFASWKRGRILCNTICPVGGLLGLMSRSPIYRIDIDTDKCIHCGKCEDVCKASCIDLNLFTVDNSRCVRCFDCSAVCPNDAIALRRGRYRLSTPMMQPTMQCNKPLAAAKDACQNNQAPCRD